MYYSMNIRENHNSMRIEKLFLFSRAIRKNLYYLVWLSVKQSDISSEHAKYNSYFKLLRLLHIKYEQLEMRISHCETIFSDSN